MLLRNAARNCTSTAKTAPDAPLPGRQPQDHLSQPCPRIKWQTRRVEAKWGMGKGNHNERRAARHATRITSGAPRLRCGCHSKIPCPAASAPLTATLRPPKPPRPGSPSRWPWRRMTDRHGHLQVSSQGSPLDSCGAASEAAILTGRQRPILRADHAPRNCRCKTLQREAALKFRDSLELFHITATTEPTNRAPPRRPHGGKRGGLKPIHCMPPCGSDSRKGADGPVRQVRSAATGCRRATNF